MKQKQALRLARVLGSGARATLDGTLDLPATARGARGIHSKRVGGRRGPDGRYASAGTMLEGYHRPAPLSGVLDRLFATVLVLSSAAAGPAALVAIDHIGLGVAETRSLRERVAKVLGNGAGKVMVCYSHTHSGARSTSGYLVSLEESVLWATQQAAAALRPARVGWGTGGVEAGVNRRPRDADGRAFMGEASDRPVDRRLGVLRVDDGTGSPLVALLWYGAHPNVLKANSNLASADWPGAARRVVEDALGCPVLFALGSAGDVNARWRGDRRALEEMGRAVGGEALDTMARIRTSPLMCLRASTKTVSLRLRPLPKGITAEKTASEVSRRWGAPTDPWLREVRRREGRGELEAELPLEIHGVRIGEGVLAGIPMEPFARIGLSVAERLAPRPVFFGGCTNGWIGYLPTADEHGAGGYEVELAPVVYGPLTGWLSPVMPGSADAVVERAVELVRGPLNLRG